VPKFRLIKFKKAYKRRVIILFLMLIILIWALYQIKMFFLQQEIKTELAISTLLDDEISSEGYFFKKETIIKLDMDRNLKTTKLKIKNGERVSKKGIIAIVSPGLNDTLNDLELKKINHKIESLSNLNKLKFSFVSSPEQISRKIYKEIKTINSFINISRYCDVAEEKEKLFQLLSEREMISGKVKNFNETIAKLKKTREQLSAKSTNNECKEIFSEEAGIFIDHVDGFESAIDLEKEIFLSRNFLQEDHLYIKDMNKERILGKIVHDIPWYIVLDVNPEYMNRFRENNSVDISICDLSDQKIPAKIVKINELEHNVVCCCDYITKELADIRHKQIIVNFGSYRGIRIPKNSIHREKIKNESGEIKEAEGVFVLAGNEILFREIIIKYMSEDYAICEQNPDLSKLFIQNPLKFYDKIVTEGFDLYNHKIIR
jgi:hypothetical protein